MFKLQEATIASIQNAFKSGELTSLELTMQYMERIANIDKSGPCLNSVVEINPEALDIAESLDREYKQSGPRGPLHGIPVLIKDNINTGDKMHTTAGSLALADNLAPYDAHIVTLLREAGAVILGKVNLNEFANFLTHGMKCGYSARGGQTVSPYGPEVNVGASSCGTGVAVTANLCTVGIGTETNGSVICPSTWNSIVGIKPTKGLVSRTGIIPICGAQDTAGPMARTVEDAVLLLNVMIGTDEEDAATASIEPYIQDYTQYLDKDGLKGMRIGVCRDINEKYKDEHEHLLPKALEVLKAAGAELVEVNLPELDDDDCYNVLMYEFKNALNGYLATCDSTETRNLLDVINFNNSDPKRCLKYDQTVALESQNKASGLLTEPEYLLARTKVLRKSRQLVDSVLNENNLDCIVQLAWNGTLPIAGYPAINVPVGLGNKTNQPIGLNFMGTAFSEATLIKAAYAFEQKMQGRVVPPID